MTPPSTTTTSDTARLSVPGLPIVFAHGVAEDLVFVGEGERHSHPPRECGSHIAWAESFPQWVEAHRDILRDAWQHGAG